MPIPLESLVATTRGHPRRRAEPGRRRAGDARRGASTTDELGWYLRRLSRMGPREVGGRVGRRGAQAAVARRRAPDRPGVHRRAGSPRCLPAGTLAAVPAGRREAPSSPTADRLLDGHAEYFGVVRDDLADPDWFLDPMTGRRAPPTRYAFDVAHRDEDAVGNIKQVWELSRHHHLTVLAAAYAVTGDERVRRAGGRPAAVVVGGATRRCPACTGPAGSSWASGCCPGSGSAGCSTTGPGAADLFEHNPVAVHQIHWHQQR